MKQNILLECLSRCHYTHANFDMENAKRDTKLLRFKCDFGKEGLCKRRQFVLRDGEKPEQRDQMCCCSSCMETGGYFRENTDLITKDQHKHLVDNWDHKLGFWRPETGCVLDRMYRSNTCVTYHCNHPLKRGVFQAYIDLVWNLARATVRVVQLSGALQLESDEIKEELK